MTAELVAGKKNHGRMPLMMLVSTTIYKFLVMLSFA